ncbi:ParB/RepB/Spo0J family partition protein [Corynebacterium choanae]|uniref:Putative chromosome-partitioning protein ParB n=1 Tax=Corynebacterium choanae TaxID=1862358 RepID=A0A3G6J9D1_9CORY|nr:ParB/RepB/Spo0J family partition protein [Corynebacterium choanae]AZA14735.1 putative chromosome-partitioning protein ParB [Corynebacterium choanae]
MATEKPKGGLGRGLASLIPSDKRRPAIGDDAADVLFGDRKPRPGSNNTPKPAHPGKPGSAPTPADLAKRVAAAAEQDTGKPVKPSPSPVLDEVNTTNTDTFGAVYKELPIRLITPNPKQPRQVFDEDALEELVHSIAEFGLMQPIIVRQQPTGDDQPAAYELIMGERRLRAAKLAGLSTIPAIVRHTSDQHMLRDALLENIHRVQLNPLEEAAAYAQLLEEFGVTHQQLAEKLGRSRPVISNMIRLLELPVAVQRPVAAGVLSAGHARALLGLQQGAAAQEQLAKRIIAEGLSVRATEEAVVLLNADGQTPVKPKPGRQPRPVPEFASRAADWLADGLDTKVTVAVGKKNRGKIIVEFAGEDDLNRIMGILREHP